MLILHISPKSIQLKFRENIPRKISPDNIRESFVQIFYKAQIDFVPSIGYFHSYMQQLQFEYIKSDDLLNHLFINDVDKIKIVVRPDNIVFNCTAEYVGWTVYSKIINEAIKILFDSKLIIDVNRIGVRYISDFNDKDIMSKVDLDVRSSLAIENDSIKKISLESRFAEDRVILNLYENEEPKETMSIDVDVIREHIHISTYVEFVEALSDVHDLEKKIFFSLLKEEYLNTLKPEY